MLAEKEFYERVRLSILTAFDFIIYSPKGKILLGKRANKPAKGFLFTPGGNIQKNESFENAIKRISKNELGITLRLKYLKFKGVYSHNYKDNFKDNKFGTHYIALAFSYKLKKNESINKSAFLKQHKEMIWLSKEEILKNKEVHENVKYYFQENPKNKLTKQRAKGRVYNL